MKRLKTLAAIMLCALSHQSLASEHPAVPDKMKDLPSFEIGDLLYRMMQPDGDKRIPWSHMANSGILWITNGYETDKRSSHRQGALRVNILGEVTTKLEQRLIEAPWTITYGATELPKFGAQFVSLVPASFESGQCFGSEYTMCSFDILPSLRKTPAKVEVLCHSESSRSPSVYKLTARDKTPLTVIVPTEVGSGGASSQVLAVMDFDRPDEELCASLQG